MARGAKYAGCVSGYCCCSGKANDADHTGLPAWSWLDRARLHRAGIDRVGLHRPGLHSPCDAGSRPAGTPVVKLLPSRGGRKSGAKAAQGPWRLDSAHVVWAVGNVCALNRVPFDTELQCRQLPPPCTTDTLIHAVRARGLRIMLKLREAAALGDVTTPCLALLASDSANDVGLIRRAGVPETPAPQASARLGLIAAISASSSSWPRSLRRSSIQTGWAARPASASAGSFPICSNTGKSGATFCSPRWSSSVTVHPPGNWRRGPTAPRSDGAAGRHGLALWRGLFGGEQTNLASSFAQHVTNVS